MYGIREDSDKTHSTLYKKTLKNHNNTTLGKRHILPIIKHSYIRISNKHSSQHSNPPTQNKNIQHFSNTLTNNLKTCQNKKSDHIRHTNQRKINQRYISKSLTRFQPQLLPLPTHKYDVYFKHKDHLEHTNQRKTNLNYTDINYKNNNTKNNIEPNTKKLLQPPKHTHKANKTTHKHK